MPDARCPKITMLDSLITSKLRIKLLTKFFINPDEKAWLRGLQSELGVSSNAVRQELNRLQQADFLTREDDGNRKLYSVNREHPLFDEVRRLMLKSVGLHDIVRSVIHRLGDLRRVYVTGALAKGIDTPVVDLYFIGEVNQAYLNELTAKAERVINKKLRIAVFTPEEWNPALLQQDSCLLIYDANTEQE